jgi:hypothetical protein
MRHVHRLLVIAAFFLSCAASFAAGKFEPVNAKDLAASPQRYWAVGIVFTDTLKAKAGRDDIRIGDERYYKFKTAIIGDCYATKEVAALLKELKAGKDYGFFGTVLQRGSRYYVIVQSLGITASSVDELPRTLGDVIRAGTNVVAEATFRRMETLLRGVQTDLLAYAKDKNIDVAMLFDPASEHRDVPAQVVRAGIQSMADQMKTSSNDLFIEFLVAILAQENMAKPVNTGAIEPVAPAVPSAPPVTLPTADVEPAPEPAPVVESVPEPALLPEAVAQPEAAPEPAVTESNPEDLFGFGQEAPQTLDESSLETFTTGGAPDPAAAPITESEAEPAVAPPAADETEPVPAAEPAAEAAPAAPEQDAVPAPAAAPTASVIIEDEVPSPTDEVILEPMDVPAVADALSMDNGATAASAPPADVSSSPAIVEPEPAASEPLAEASPEPPEDPAVPGPASPNMLDASAPVPMR